MPKANNNANIVLELADQLAAHWSSCGVGRDDRLRLDDCFNSLAGLFIKSTFGFPFSTTITPDSLVELLTLPGGDLARLLKDCSKLFVDQQQNALLSQGINCSSENGLRAFFFSALYENIRFDPRLLPPQISTKKRTRSKRRCAAYFSPPALAYLAAYRALSCYYKGRADNSELPRLFDPAMGTGLYLIAALDHLSLANPDANPAYIASRTLFGSDIDAITCSVARCCLIIAAGGAIPELEKHLLWADAFSMERQDFDIVLSNPPWGIAKNKSQLPGAKVASRINKSKIGHLRRHFEHQGEGDTSYYKLFLELSYQHLKDGGVGGLLMPMAFCGDVGAAPLRRLLWDSCSWQTVDGFINEDNAFSIHPHFKYVLVSFKKGGVTDSIDLRFGLRAGRDRLLQDPVGIDPDEKVTIRGQNLKYTRLLRDTVSGGNGAILELGGGRDADLLVELALKHGRLSHFFMRYGAAFKREYDITLDRSKFFTAKESETLSACLPLLEGANIGQFDPVKNLDSVRFFVRIEDFEQGQKESDIKVGFISTSSPFNTRSMISSCLPDWPAANSLPVIKFHEGPLKIDGPDTFSVAERALYLTAVFNSFVFDWMIRLRLSGNNLSYHLLQEMIFPLPSPVNMDTVKSCVALAAILTFGNSGEKKPKTAMLPAMLMQIGGDAFYSKVFKNIVRQLHHDDFAYTPVQLLRARLWLEILICSLFDLDAVQVSYILRDCDFEERVLLCRRRLLRSKVGESEPPAPDQRSFFRVDKSLKPGHRLPVLVRDAYRYWKSEGLDSHLSGALFSEIASSGQCPNLPAQIECALNERFDLLLDRPFV